MANLNYKEQLNDPRWQQKRLRIMERDLFTCCCCGSNFMKLNVHHLYYLKNLAPWEYDDEAMVTLCDSCHDFAHTSLTKIASIIAFKVLKNNKDINEIYHALCQI